MTDFLDRLVETNFPKLKKFYETEQYNLSLKILHEKNMLGKTAKEMAEILNLNEDEYLTFEDGYDSKTVEEYHNILTKIKVYKTQGSKTTKY